jgi:hypothetical protein
MTFNINQTDKEAKSRTYVEAIVRFICCGKALEVSLVGFSTLEP